MTTQNLHISNIRLKLLLAFTFLCPLFYLTYFDGNTRVTQEIFFEIGTMVLFSVVMLENIYLSLFIIWAVVIYCFYQFPMMGGNYLSNLMFAGVLYQVTYTIINKDNLKSLFKCIIILAIANLYYMLAQNFGWDLIFKNNATHLYNIEMNGFMGLKCFMGMFFALCIPIIAYKNTWLSLLMFVPIYISEASTAMVAGVVAFLFTLWFKSKKLFLISLIPLILGGSIYIKHDQEHANMFSDRISVWKVSLRDAISHPVMGWGLDSFRNILPYKNFIYFKNYRTNESRQVNLNEIKTYNDTHELQNENFKRHGDPIDPWDHPHNEFVSIIYEFGFTGMIIFSCMLFDMYKKFTPSSESIAITGVLLCFLIFSVGHFPFHVARLGYLAPIFLGCFYKLNYQPKGVNNGERKYDYYED